MNRQQRAYRSRAWAAALVDTDSVGKRTGPYLPRINGKVEHFNRTMADECLYTAMDASSGARRQALGDWVHTYNRVAGRTG